MAEGKNSFVLYTDQKEIFEALDNEQAGKLIKHIFRYVTDENPTTDDPIVRAVFIGIQQALKRDLKKWETKQAQRKRAGEESARRRKEAAKIAKQNSKNSTTVNDRQHPSTVNGSVSGSVSGSVNVNVSTDVDDYKKSDIGVLIPIEKNIENYLSDKKIVKAVIENSDNKIRDVSHLEKKLCEFQKHLAENGKHMKTFDDFASHFRYWNKKTLEIKGGNNPASNRPNRY